MRNILLIRRLQDDLKWEDDCYDIATEVVKDLNYSFPYMEYTELLKEALGRFIAEGEIYLSHPIDLDDLFYTVFMQGFNYALKHDENAEYFEFDLTENEKYKIMKLIDKYTKLFYNDNNEIIKKLKSVPKDVVFIYPKKFYLQILLAFYKHDNPKFIASYNNDIDCIKQYCELNNIDEKSITRIF